MKQKMDSLCTILQESLELYENFIKVEYEKYGAVIKDDIKKLDEVISEEQVFYLKVKGLEQKREQLIESMGMKDKTLKEIISMSNQEDSARLTLLYDKLLIALTEFKKINLECKTIVEVRLHRIDAVMNKLGEKDNGYPQNEIQKNNLKSNIVSKKF